MEHVMETLMSMPEAGLRGGAVTTLLLLAALLLRDSGRSPAGRNCALLVSSTAGYVICSAPGVATFESPLGFSLLIVSLGIPALFWISAAAVFDDAFKPSWYRGFAWLGLVALGLYSIFTATPFVDIAYYALAFVFVGLGAWHALAGGESDLVEARRRLRILVAVATALYSAAIIVVNMLSPGSSVSAPLSIFNAVGLIAMSFAVTIAWAGIVRGTWPVPLANSDPMPAEVSGNQAQAPQPADGQETALLATLRRLMDEQKLYRQDRLSLSVLAGRLGIPEYRLRRLINGRLGHRNFSSFINGYRLAEARAALADPCQADVPILTIALDTGFQSLAPFNRAFKTAAGMTPSQYRRQHLSRLDPICAT
jgi:AraC-like DNA-binding protein